MCYCWMRCLDSFACCSFLCSWCFPPIGTLRVCTRSSHHIVRRMCRSSFLYGGEKCIFFLDTDNLSINIPAVSHFSNPSPSIRLFLGRRCLYCPGRPLLRLLCVVLLDLIQSHSLVQSFPFFACLVAD